MNTRILYYIIIIYVSDYPTTIIPLMLSKNIKIKSVCHQIKIGGFMFENHYK